MADRAGTGGTVYYELLLGAADSVPRRVTFPAPVRSCVLYWATRDYPAGLRAFFLRGDNARSPAVEAYVEHWGGHLGAGLAAGPFAGVANPVLSFEEAPFTDLVYMVQADTPELESTEVGVLAAVYYWGPAAGQGFTPIVTDGGPLTGV